MTQQEEDKLEDSFIEFWDTHSDKLGLGRYTSEITRHWIAKIKEREESLVERIKNFNITNDTMGNSVTNPLVRLEDIKRFIVDLINKENE